MAEEQQKLTFTLNEEGELVVMFPDGLHFNTKLCPGDQDLALLHEMERSTLVKTFVKQMRSQAIHDNLTGLLLQTPARSIYRQKLESWRMKRFEGIVSVLFLDIDHFKQFNKKYGQDAGDYTLRWVSKIIEQCLREGDIPARWGGDEFVAFCPAHVPSANSEKRGTDPGFDRRISTGTTLGDLQQVFLHGKTIADRIRTTVENSACMYDGKVMPVTVTIGVANGYIPAGAVTIGLFEQLFKRAYEVAYKAKLDGARNETVVADLIRVAPQTDT